MSYPYNFDNLEIISVTSKSAFRNIHCPDNKSTCGVLEIRVRDIETDTNYYFFDYYDLDDDSGLGKLDFANGNSYFTFAHTFNFFSLYPSADSKDIKAIESAYEKIFNNITFAVRISLEYFCSNPKYSYKKFWSKYDIKPPIESFIDKNGYFKCRKAINNRCLDGTLSTRFISGYILPQQWLKFYKCLK